MRIAGLALGMGLGGFVDGIVLHQILQLHGTVSSRVPLTTLLGTKVNMFWDGVFHAGVWALTLIGVVLMHRSARAGRTIPGRTLAGAMLAGWGVFNVVEGSINHHWLGLHRVHQLGPAYWDYLFLLSGVVLIAWGWLWARQVR